VNDDDVNKDDGDGDDGDNDDEDEDYMPGNASKGESKMDPAMIKERAKHSEEEKKINDARFSINVIDLLKSPKEIHFGKWNSRPLVPQEWGKLKVSLTAQGVKPFSMEHMMPLVISRRHVDLACVDNNVDGYNAKMLVLSEEGKNELRKLEMAGGRHRMAAVQSIKEDMVDDLDKLKKLRQSAKRKRVTKDEASAKMDETVKRYDEKIASVEEEISRTGLWGVILYDKGK